MLKLLIIYLKSSIRHFYNNFANRFDQAAQGVVETFKKGESGSTWIINNNKTHEITADIRRAYKTMSSKAYRNITLE